MSKRRIKRPGMTASLPTRRVPRELNRSDRSSSKPIGSIMPFGELDPTTFVRTLVLQGHAEVPDGAYGIVDAYCTDPGCDCRVAYLYIMPPSHADQALAYINVGWEPLSFYRQWGPWMDDSDAMQLKGPSLMAMMPQSALAPAWLEIVRGRLNDPEYLNFFKTRYFQFKALLDHRG